MAEKTVTQADRDLDAFAFEIFKTAVANHPVKRGGENVAIDAYRKAQAFMAVRERVKSGGLEQETDNTLSNCSAPNLKRTHPLNLVSQRFGDLGRVNRIKAWLDRNPTPEREPEDLALRLNREFSDLGWDLPTINVARAVFPTYCKG